MRMQLELPGPAGSTVESLARNQSIICAIHSFVYRYTVSIRYSAAVSCHSRMVPSSDPDAYSDPSGE